VNDKRNRVHAVRLDATGPAVDDDVVSGAGRLF